MRFLFAELQKSPGEREKNCSMVLCSGCAHTLWCSIPVSSFSKMTADDTRTCWFQTSYNNHNNKVIREDGDVKQFVPTLRKVITVIL